jgi:Uma2 family endonuclease
MDGPPIFAVEILSPSDKNEDIDEKIDEYLEAGVKLVWIVDPHLETVLVLRPDAPPRLYNVTETLDGEPHLPGFSTPVAMIFE